MIQYVTKKTTPTFCGRTRHKERRKIFTIDQASKYDSFFVAARLMHQMLVFRPH
jgi:hypothetical protein